MLQGLYPFVDQFISIFYRVYQKNRFLL